MSVFNHEVCANCNGWHNLKHRKECPYRNMSLPQYLNYKNIPFEFKKGGSELYIDTSNLMNGSAMIELDKEIRRTGNYLVETGWDYKIVR